MTQITSAIFSLRGPVGQSSQWKKVLAVKVCVQGQVPTNIVIHTHTHSHTHTHTHIYIYIYIYIFIYIHIYVYTFIYIIMNISRN